MTFLHKTSCSNFANSIMKNMKFKDLSTDDQFDLADHSMRQYQSKMERKPTYKQEDAMRKRQIAEHNKHEKLLSKCWHCLDSQQFQVPIVNLSRCMAKLSTSTLFDQKHLTVSMGVAMYLSLPSRKIVCPGHCVLATTDHISAMTDYDENIYEEYQVIFCLKTFL